MSYVHSSSRLLYTGKERVQVPVKNFIIKSTSPNQMGRRCHLTSCSVHSLSSLSHPCIAHAVNTSHTHTHGAVSPRPSTQAMRGGAVDTALHQCIASQEPKQSSRFRFSSLLTRARTARTHMLQWSKRQDSRT